MHSIVNLMFLSGLPVVVLLDPVESIDPVHSAALYRFYALLVHYEALKTSVRRWKSHRKIGG